MYMKDFVTYIHKPKGIENRRKAVMTKLHVHTRVCFLSFEAEIHWFAISGGKRRALVMTLDLMAHMWV